MVQSFILRYSDLSVAQAVAALLNAYIVFPNLFSIFLGGLSSKSFYMAIEVHAEQPVAHDDMQVPSGGSESDVVPQRIAVILDFKWQTCRNAFDFKVGMISKSNVNQPSEWE